MTKRTQTSRIRKYEIIKTEKGIVRVKRAVPLPAQPREEVTCKTCGRKKMLSVGQIWNCKHKD